MQVIREKKIKKIPYEYKGKLNLDLFVSLQGQPMSNELGM